MFYVVKHKREYVGAQGDFPHFPHFSPNKKINKKWMKESETRDIMR